ncbi:hypothetical protein [Prosthecobacter sp.]|uniref:hypothetical protein n=1 Tax=Prosthecobacter sp. TaxID=1965333 RepID=UPI003782DB05
MSMNTMGLMPEERKEIVRSQLRESLRILADLHERRDLSAEAFEFELRMQILWLTNAANQWHQATEEEKRVLQMREFYLKREGAAQ